MRSKITLLFMIINLFVYSQNPQGDYATNKYSIIPPAPEVASLMKYIDVPVSHFTGQPQIEIPLYTITEGSLSVPISLSYKGGGIKQNELSGIISKGWTLMAGMSISRTVHGLPDECNKNPSTQYWIRGLFHLSSNDKDLRTKIIQRTGDFDPAEFNINRVCPYNECADYENGYVDFANDIYKFYGQGMSGTFIFNESQHITMSTASPIKMDFSTGWKYCDYSMTDKNQTKYIFGEGGVETTQTPINAYGYNLNIEIEEHMEKLVYPSAWHITQLQSIHGDIIDFEYSDPIYRNNYLGLTQYYTYYNGGTWCYLTDRAAISAMRTKYYERNLIAIKSKSTTIRFHYTSELTQLSSISIHKNDSITTELWRYQIMRDSIGNMTHINQIKNSKIQQLYGFSYRPKDCFSQYAIDHWGYCNGDTNNTKNNTLLPKVSGFEHISYKKSNREPNETYAKEGILTHINYPMGGYTKFNWEANDYSYVKDIDSYLMPETHNVVTTETFNLRGTAIEQRLNSGTHKMNRNDCFKIDLSKYLEPIMNGASPFQTGFQTEYDDYTHSEPYPRLDVYENGQIIKQYYIDKYNSKSEIILSTNDATYQFKLVNPRSFIGMSETDINNFWGANATTAYENYGYINIVKVQYSEQQNIVIKPWGGLRIASIESHSQENHSVQKEFDYRQIKNNVTYSTGVIKSLPKYTHQSGAYYLDNAIGYEYAPIYGFNSNGIASSTNGEIGIEYSEVWETLSGTLQGKIGYFFDTHKNYPDTENCLIGGYVPEGLKTLTSKAFKRGNLKEKQYWGFVNENVPNEDTLYKKEIYDYGIPEGSCNYDFSGPLHSICDFSEIDYSDNDSTGDILYKNYTINKYKLIPYNKRIKSEIVWEKDFYSDTESEQTITYTYYDEDNGYSDKPWNSFVRTKSYVNSRGQTVKEYYTYYKIGNIPLDLKELEVIVVDDIVMSARRNIYGSNHKLAQTFTGCVGMQFSTNFSIPMNIQNSATYPSIDKKEYSYKYDSQGNVVEISYNGKILASYLWGYMGKHPIVEVVGMSYDELFNIAKDYNYVTGLFLDDMNLFLNSFRADKRLQGKEVLTYTYHWLLGMATSTDSRGVTNTYFLDDFGRLSGVKDTNGYYISKYDYNYKGF